MKDYKRTILVYLFSIIILFTNGCKNPVEISSPLSSITEETPIVSQSLTPTLSPTPVIKGNPDEGSEIGQIYEIGRFDWDLYDRNAGKPLLWKILDIKNGKALMILAEDLIEISEEFDQSDISADSLLLHRWLNFDFVNRSFGGYFLIYPYFFESVSRQFGDVKSEARFFLLNGEEKNIYFPNSSPVNTDLRPVMWFPLNNTNINYNDIWDFVLDQFIYRLKSHNLDNLIQMLGIYGKFDDANLKSYIDAARPFYEFLIDADFGDINVKSRKLNQYESGYEYVLEINVTTSQTDYFKVGSNLFEIKIGSDEANSIQYFRHVDEKIEIINYSSAGACKMAYEFFRDFVGNSSFDFDEITDLNDIVPDKETDKESYISFVSYLVRFLPTGDKSSVTLDELATMTKSALGIENIDFTMHQGYDVESDSVIIYGMGGTWFFCSQDNLVYDEQTGITIVDVSFYLDCAYTVVGRSYQFEMMDNGDGTFRIKSVKKTYDSGLPLAYGSI